MTGVSNDPRASSSNRPRRLGAARTRIVDGRLVAALVSAAVAAAGCSSELGDGNPAPIPGFTGLNPDGTPASGGTIGPDGNVIPGGVNAPGEGNPSVGGLERTPSISGTGDVGPLTDPAGNPLPVDQLPPLQACSTPGPQQIRRLTVEQYRNTLASVFGDGLPDITPFQDAGTLGYNVDADDSLILNLDAQSVNGLAEEVATLARQNNLISQLANNCMNLNDNGCRETFVRNVGERLTREPLDTARLQRYTGLFSATAEDGTPLVTTFEDGAEMVISAMIQSPYAIYRREIGSQQGNEFVLSSYEVASELSYMLTNNPPDQALMEAARNDQLSSPDQILAQAERLLATADAEDVLSGFVTAWLSINKITGKVKEGVDISDQLRDEMLEETRQLFLDVFYNDGTIGDLFSAQRTFMNQSLASFYGLDGMASGADFQEVDISGGVRVPGVLGHGAYLAAHALSNNSSPVQRAFIVRERILCNDLPEVPEDLDTNLRPQSPNATSRQRYAEHSSNPVCYNCHQLMDPIGFTFESYDGYGRFRELEAGQPIDTSGGLALMDENGPLGIDVPLASVSDLSMYLASSEQVRACLANNLSYFAYGVANDAKWTAEEKICTDHYVRQVARDSGNTLRSVLTGILTAPHFTRRVQAK